MNESVRYVGAEFVAGVSNIRPGGQNPAGFGKCEAGHRFWTFNCIYKSFTAFPTDTDLLHGLYQINI